MLMKSFGQIIILNGAPRAGKSSIALAIQATFPGAWKILGVDTFTKENTPAQYRPGIGLRPGGERPDLEPIVEELYASLHDALARASERSENIVVDVGYHDSYSQPLNIRAAAAERLKRLPVLFVGVRCPIEEITNRRNRETGDGYVKGTVEEPVPAPVQRWQDEVHKPGIYDIEVDTSQMSPEECAERIRERLESGLLNNAFWKYGSA